MAVWLTTPFAIGFGGRVMSYSRIALQTAHATNAACVALQPASMSSLRWMGRIDRMEETKCSRKPRRAPYITVWKSAFAISTEK